MTTANLAGAHHLRAGERIAQRRFLLSSTAACTPHEAVDRRIDNVVRGLIDVGVRQGDRVGCADGDPAEVLWPSPRCHGSGRCRCLAARRRPGTRRLWLGGVAPTSSPIRRIWEAARHLALQVLVLGGGVPRPASARRHRRDRHGVDRSRRGDAAGVVPPEPGYARDLAFVAFNTVGGELVAKQITNYRWALSAFGTASATAALSASDTVYCLTPLHHQSGLRSPSAARWWAAPASPCRAA